MVAINPLSIDYEDMPADAQRCFLAFESAVHVPKGGGSFAFTRYDAHAPHEHDIELSDSRAALDATAVEAARRLIAALPLPPTHAATRVLISMTPRRGLFRRKDGHVTRCVIATPE